MSAQLTKSGTPSAQPKMGASSAKMGQPQQQQMSSAQQAQMKQGAAGMEQKEQNIMTRHHLWVYIIVTIIVLIIIFWYGASQQCHWKKMCCKGVEWACSSSGKLLLGLFLIIALLMFAWSCASVAGWCRMMGVNNKANMVIGIFIIVIILVLIAFIQFFRKDFSTAYWLMLVVLIIAIIGTILFAYWKATGPAIAMGIFAIWALVMTYIFQRINSCNSKCKNNGTSNSNSSGDTDSNSTHSGGNCGRCGKSPCQCGGGGGHGGGGGGHGY